MKRKLTTEEGLLINCYETLLKETGEVPTVEEVQAEFNKRYGNK
jgi:hypothetical protein